LDADDRARPVKSAEKAKPDPDPAAKFGKPQKRNTISFFRSKGDSSIKPPKPKEEKKKSPAKEEKKKSPAKGDKGGSALPPLPVRGDLPKERQPGGPGQYGGRLPIGGVPEVVTKLVAAIEGHRDSLATQGLYRVSADASEVKAVIKELNADPGTANLAAVLDIHTLAAALKQYFRELPDDDKITKDVKARLYAVLENAEVDKKAFAKAYATVHPRTRAVLDFLADHLINLEPHVEKNLMTDSNIALVWGPNVVVLSPEELGSGKTHLKLFELLLKMARDRRDGTHLFE